MWRLLYTLVYLAAGAVSLGALGQTVQGSPVEKVDTLAGRSQTVRMLDGPMLKADTLETRLQTVPSFGRAGFMRSYRSPSVIAPSPFSPSLVPPDQFEFETREQLAERINAQANASVMLSVDKDLYWHRIPKYSRSVRMAMSLAGLFLSNPFGFADGYVPLMNPSFPFIFAATPGWAPYEHPYSTEAFPQSVGAEFDLATGTYKQVMKDWSEVQKNMARSFGGSYRYEPVPKIPVTPVERAMQQR